MNPLEQENPNYGHDEAEQAMNSDRQEEYASGANAAVSLDKKSRSVDAFSSSSESSSGSDDSDDSDDSNHSDGDSDESNKPSDDGNSDDDLEEKETGSRRVSRSQLMKDEQISSNSEFMQQAESLVLGEILEQSAAPYQEPTNAQKRHKRWSAEKKQATFAHGSSFNPIPTATKISSKEDDLTGGMLPDVLTTVRQKIESMTLFDSDLFKEIGKDFTDGEDEEARKSKENLRRVFQQSISASILVSLSHKRYERRRNAAMDIEKVVRSLVQENELERVRAVLVFLSEDFVRSTNEDARKGGVVALAACGIGLKKADKDNPHYDECKDLILASVVHACQDHNQRVRYYATESLFNVIKVLPPLAVQHFFILFEILRSLYADVDIDVRSGAQLLDKKLKEIIIAAINNGSFTTEACIPLFSRYVNMRNKATKRLTLTWLQDFSEKLVGSPMVGFLHFILGGVFATLADPNASIREASLIFLETILPQLLGNNEDFEENESSLYVDFDKILQSLVSTMEHPDPFVRKVAMYWMNQIIRTYLVDNSISTQEEQKKGSPTEILTSATISVRNSLPHVLPGVLLSIGDQFTTRSTTTDAFLPGMTTRGLAEQTNNYFQNAVRSDGKTYVSHLDGFIVALREELDSPGGLATRNPAAVEREPFRLDVKSDGTGIESTGWFRSSDSENDPKDALLMSRLCALDWVIVLYEGVVPYSLKAQYAKEFISPILHQLVENPPEQIIIKSFEVLAKITTPLNEDKSQVKFNIDETLEGMPIWAKTGTNLSGSNHNTDVDKCEVMKDENIDFALDIMDGSKKKLKSRDREVFGVLIHLYSRHYRLLTDLGRVIKIMCKLQPAEFVFVSFAVELENFVSNSWANTMHGIASAEASTESITSKQKSLARDLEFVSSFVHQMNNVFLVASETKGLRFLLLDSIGHKQDTDESDRKSMLFQIILRSYAHNLAAASSLCLWGGAYLTISSCFQSTDPLDMNLMFYLQLDQLIEMLERPIFRHLHLRMLERDDEPGREGSGAMLFRCLKSLLMLLPQSTSYEILKDRLLAISKFRQCSMLDKATARDRTGRSLTLILIDRIKEVRKIHCDAKWRSIREESLEPVLIEPDPIYFSIDEEQSRREWLGYVDENDEIETKEKMGKIRNQKIPSKEGYDEFENMIDVEHEWKTYWVQNGQ